MVQRARPIVAIDGPAGAGKSTAAREVAARLGYALLDTGAIYRTLALVAREAGVSWDDGAALAHLVPGLAIRFSLEGDLNRVFLGDREVTRDIRTPEIAAGASVVSAHPPVRDALLDLQRQLGRNGGVVVEGRDVGTVVFPDAEVKFFLTATVNERARRRTAELRALGQEADEEATRQEIEDRDLRDSTRAAAPLRQAEDAVEVDSTRLGIDDVVEEMIRLVRSRGG